MRNHRLNIEKHMYEELLDTFMPSTDMREYLKTKSLSPLSLMEMMLGAPIGLVIKREWFSKLSEIEIIEDDEVEEEIEIHVVTFKELFEEVDSAIKELEDGMDCVYTVQDCWYDDDIKEKKSYLLGVDDSYNGIINRILCELVEEEYFDDSSEEDSNEHIPTWYEVAKWNGRNNHVFEAGNTYYWLETEVIWFERPKVKIDMKRSLTLNSFFRFSTSSFMKLPIPYKAGDIIAIDTWPVGPMQPAIIYDIASDGEFVSVLTRGIDGNWYEGSLFNQSWGRSTYQYDMISPLYNIRIWEEALGPDATVFEAVSDYVKAADENSGKLWNTFRDSRLDKYTDKEILGIIASL